MKNRSATVLTVALAASMLVVAPASASGSDQISPPDAARAASVGVADLFEVTPADGIGPIAPAIPGLTVPREPGTTQREAGTMQREAGTTQREEGTLSAADADTIFDAMRGRVDSGIHDAFGRFVSSASGGASIDLLSLVERQRPSASHDADTSNDPSLVSTWRGFLDDRDIDGDGVNDIFGYELQEEAGSWEILDIELVAWRGTDGARLWSRDIYDDDSFNPFLVLLSDVTGDGVEDFALLDIGSVAGTPTCLPFFGCILNGGSFEWRMAVASGGTGQDQWTKVVPGDYSSKQRPIGRMYETKAWALVVTDTMDRDGDGGAELVVNVVDMKESRDYAAGGVSGVSYSIRGEHFETTTRVDLLKGSTGGSLAQFEATSDEAVEVVLPIGDATGDAREDFAWMPVLPLPEASGKTCVNPVTCIDSGSDDEGSRISVLDGAMLDEAWTLPLPDSKWPLPVSIPDRDFNGDGKADIVVTDGIVQEYFWPDLQMTSLRVVSGADGSVLWNRTFDEDTFAWFYTDLGPAGGTIGDDLLVLEFRFGGPNRAVRVDGATGADLLSTTPDWWMWIAGDVDGDQVADLSYWAYDEALDESHFLIESGRDGSIIWQQSVDDWYTDLFPIGDLNGDGTVDVLEISGTSHRRNFDLRMRALSMPSGEEISSETRTLDGNTGGIFRTVDDVLGDGGEDIHFTWYRTDPRGWSYTYISKIEVLDGDSLESAWEAGDAFPPVPPIGTASITGRVVDASGSPIEGICVLPHPEGWQTHGTSSDEEGRYTLDELDAGAYMLKFRDCGPGQYAYEWYDDVKSVSLASAVVLLEGESRDLGDVSLATVPGPDNDLIADAIEMTTLPFHDERSMVGATVSDEPDDGFCWDDRSIWYAFNAPRDMDLRATVAGDSDVSMTFFELTEGRLEQRSYCGSTDDVDSFAEVDAEAGGRYYLRVAGSKWWPPTIDLTVEEIELPRIVGRVIGEDGNPVAGACVTFVYRFPEMPDDYWYQLDPVEADDEGRYRSLELDAGEYRVRFEDCRARQYADEWHENAASIFEATDVAVARDSGSILIDAELEGPLQPPVNDFLEDALEIEAPFVDRRSTYGSSSEIWDEFCSPNRNTVWYRFTAPSDGTLSIDTRGSNFDTMLGAYLSHPTPVTTIACEDDTFGQQAAVWFPVSAGLEYLIQAGGWLGNRGALRLEVQFSPAASAASASSFAPASLPASSGNGRQVSAGSAPSVASPGGAFPASLLR